jgi:hypothetical protein
MDVARYSAAMEADEENTFKKLLSYREIIDPLIDKYQGRIFNTAGDAVLAEFSSPTQAVRFSIECQDALGKLNEGSEDKKNFAFRIGINLGDVIINRGDLLGDEVNIAARIESLAEPGGICMSAKVYEEVKGRIVDVEFISLGAPPLKNINRSIEIFSLSMKRKIEHIPTSSVFSHWGDNDKHQGKTSTASTANSLKFSGISARRSGASQKDLNSDPRRSDPGTSRATVLPRELKNSGQSIQAPFRRPEKPKNGLSDSLKPGNQVVFPSFVMDSLRRLDEGDENEIENLLRFLGENSSHQLANTINKKLAALIEATNDAEKLMRIGSICDKSKEKSINEKAVISYRKAVANKSTPALEHLGKILTRRPVVKFDVQEGVRCLESAASLRSASAAMHLAEIYQSGLIGEKDLVQAFLWYWVAAHLGDSVARSRLREISVLMNLSQRRLAASKADEFYKNLILKKYYAG